MREEELEGLAFHPLADLFPLIEGREFDELVEDVRANGLRERVVLHEGRILDGRNRFRAARAAGLIDGEVHNLPAAIAAQMFRLFDPLVEGEPLKWVLSKNLYRRHLSPSQLSMVAADLGKLRQGRPNEWNRGAPGENKPAGLPDSPATQAERAALVGTSERNVRAADFVKGHAAEEVVAAVRHGEVTVSAAAELARLPIAEQLEILRNADPRAFARVARERRGVTQSLKRERRIEREISLAARQRALPDARFGVILADPEWRFETWSAETGMDRAADNHYPTSTLEAIKARPVHTIAADDCVLFLWATVPMLPQAIEVLAAWGFAYKSHVIWHKVGQQGTGYWFRNEHELLLVGTRGDLPAPIMGEQWSSVLSEAPGEHSAKPEGSFRLIEEYFPNLPKIELNARTARPGWTAWGLEAPDEIVDPLTGEVLEPQPAPWAAPDGGEGADLALAATGPRSPATADEDAACAPVEPCTDEHGDGNGLRLKGNATACPDPSVGSRESGSLAAESGITQCEDDASPAPHPEIRRDEPADTIGEGHPSLPDRPNPAAADAIRDIIVEGYRTDTPVAEIAARTGLTRNAVKKRAGDLKLSSRDRQRRMASAFTTKQNAARRDAGAT
jgi:N6-adenosine-specific RNA methylase IME4